MSKAHPRVRAYGTIDELNAHLGLAVSALPVAAAAVKAQLLQVQEDLFVIGSQLARPAAAEAAGKEPSADMPELGQEAVSRLEDWIDATEVPPLRHFILPGGHEAASRLHVCRAVCRRAERTCVRLAADAYVSPLILSYLNRLADYLFTAARAVNHETGSQETPWRP